MDKQLAEALDAVLDVCEFPKLYSSSERGNIIYRAKKALRAYHDAQPRCPECGCLTGPFERLGSGVCNECLAIRGSTGEASTGC